MSAAPVLTSKVLDSDNVTLRAGAGGLAWKALTFLGVIFVLLTFVGVLAGDADARSAGVHAFHTGFIFAVSAPLGALVFIMILHQTQAGWAVAIRRQWENIMSLLPLGAGLFVAGVVLNVIAMNSGEHGTYLFHWIEKWLEADTLPATDLYMKKKLYLNVPFFLIRGVGYFAVWLGLGYALWSLSRRQDEDGDKTHSLYARKLSAVGLPLFAFTTAFASFDWMMSLDYHWFSTMFAVYFFAQNMFAALAVGGLVLLLVQRTGRLRGLFTEEHRHDFGKLLFAFAVFWAYIAFSQYFLIWYANIPEETMWFNLRKTGGDGWMSWETLSWVVPICHFIVPFIVLLPRPARRSPRVLMLMCVWMIGFHIVDLVFVIRPVSDAPFSWLDVVGIAGPVCLFFGLLIRQIAGNPLVSLKDPRLDEALHHKNYV